MNGASWRRIAAIGGELRIARHRFIQAAADFAFAPLVHVLRNHAIDRMAHDIDEARLIKAIAHARDGLGIGRQLGVVRAGLAQDVRRLRLVEKARVPIQSAGVLPVIAEKIRLLQLRQKNSRLPRQLLV